MSLPYSERILSGFMTLKRLPTSNTSCTAWQRHGGGVRLLTAQPGLPCSHSCTFRTSQSHPLAKTQTRHAPKHVKACRGTCKLRARNLLCISSHFKPGAATAPQRM